MSELDPVIQKYVEAANNLNDAIREAHGVAKDLERIIKEGRELERRLPDAIDNRINDGVKQGLADFKEALKIAIDQATQSVYDRFDTIADILMGQDDRAKKAGLEPMPELIGKLGEGLPPGFRKSRAVRIRKLRKGDGT